MPRLVEDAGGELSAGYAFKHFRHRAGELRVEVGGRAVVGVRVPEGVSVSHPAAVAGRGPLRYTLRTVRTVLPSGGRRAWWACPECNRRADSLYLPAGRERLACRRCCGLTYRSQQTTKPVKARKSRPGHWVEWSCERWEYSPQEGRLVLVAGRKGTRRV